MTIVTAGPTGLVPADDTATPARLAASLSTRSAPRTDLADYLDWHRWMGQRVRTDAERVPLECLQRWHTDPGTGAIRHDSGGFFAVTGLDVRLAPGPVPHWRQPILDQPEVGILGIIVREFDGVLHCLMQAKDEPGNCDGVQLSPTVQATRSNYTGVHRGAAVPYVEYFREPGRYRVLADTRQSEQGGWFRGKRNRNIIIEVSEPVPVYEGYRWLPLHQVLYLLRQDNHVNMDARSVLSCLPLADAPMAEWVTAARDCDAGSGFRAALLHSYRRAAGSRHGLREVLSWLTGVRTRTELYASPVPLPAMRDWSWRDGRISHRDGRFFDVIGVAVTASGREVHRWSQPMIAPRGIGVAAFLVRRIAGVLHVLVQARAEPGCVDTVELGPTVQCDPENYRGLPAESLPRFLPEAVDAAAEQVRFDALLSEEGGRFYHARNRYRVVETDLDVDADDPSFRWLSVHQLLTLVQHSHYLNVEARSLLACLHGLAAGG